MKQTNQPTTLQKSNSPNMGKGEVGKSEQSPHKNKYKWTILLV